MRSTAKNVLVLANFFLVGGYLNTEYLAETNQNLIINLLCKQNFKEEMSKANINFDEELAKETCDCYLKEFINSKSHQKAINTCRSETKKKLDL